MLPTLCDLKYSAKAPVVRVLSDSIATSTSSSFSTLTQSQTTSPPSTVRFSPKYVPTDCSIPDTFSFNTDFCWSLRGGSSFTVSGTTYIGFSRFFPFQYDGEGNRIPLTETSTDFDKCLPGPSSCSLLYSGGPCPQAFSRMKRAETGTVTTEWCCPSAGRLLNMHSIQYVEYISTSKYTGTTTVSLDSCTYEWTGSGRIPLTDAAEVASGKYSTTATFFQHLAILAITVTYNSTTSTSIASSPPKPSAVPSNSLPTSNTLAPTTGGLTTSSKIGIGVGVGIGGLLLVSAITLVLFVLRRHARARHSHDGEDLPPPTRKPELPADDIPKHKFLPQVASEPVHELADTAKPVELGESAAKKAEDTGNIEGGKQVELSEGAAVKVEDIGDTDGAILGKETISPISETILKRGEESAGRKKQEGDDERSTMSPISPLSQWSLGQAAT
ncbi:hypothetical protein CC80DRAFT_507863 [Byssothecium circinans]|uniref:Uncharacterized protein n=1 Tax=Byssothecium circinans TaxID=147558 RepID=A0A6A5TJY5_9PLEO|nr:hypothetical protein CC80DRAFT_507863 [Byssothecium circinans]